ncbi:uncharacterized protein BCR38DRAFT_527689 [Pseudomassariella vexata]|uniref:Rhodopsin domain-containing protein n=1 Tax=Pseudomassariella vexata TaxID=1141098 RepID=A0A1Y2DFV6_9PEZI|nr:uncharacterized protein BCR38DRAFT_527689 [Pseudomassariella vexata]ORY58148.1 hypothetical protein BCR38DRAFT_527689 [Pseudomassariella vexata]
MPTIAARAYDEAAAKAAYVQKMADIAATQDLSQDLRSNARALTIAFTVLAAVVVVMRLLSRRRQGAPILIDDWLIIASQVLLFANCAMNMVLIDSGVGLHSGSLTLEQLEKMNMTMVGAEILYVTAVNMYKISLLFLYFRIFPMRNIRIGAYICGGLSMLWNLACILAAVIQCLPREKLWHPWKQGTCVDLFLTQLCISVPTILLDIAILCLPMPHVWRLKTNMTQRIFLTIIFLLGSYVVFTSIYRFVVYLGYNSEDNSYTLGEGIAWNIIEISSGIVSACLPTLGPLVRLVFTTLYSTRTGSKGSKNVLGGSSYVLGGSSYVLKRSDAAVTIGGGSSHVRTGNFTREESKYGIMLDDEPYHDSSRRGKMITTVSHNRDSSGDRSSHDEIPLTAIRQETRVEWVTEERSITPGEERMVHSQEGLGRQ